jgi:hypothetical protein
MNHAMGAELLWKLIIGSTKCWKQALWKKYFTGSQRRSSTLQPSVDIGSPIFKFLLDARPLITKKLN